MTLHKCVYHGKIISIRGLQHLQHIQIAVIGTIGREKFRVDNIRVRQHGLVVIPQPIERKGLRTLETYLLPIT